MHRPTSGSLASAEAHRYVQYAVIAAEVKSPARTSDRIDAAVKLAHRTKVRVIIAML